MKRVDLFGGSDDDDSTRRREQELLTEAKRNKLRNIEVFAKELEIHQTETLETPKKIEIDPILLDEDSSDTDVHIEKARKIIEITEPLVEENRELISKVVDGLFDEELDRSLVSFPFAEPGHEDFFYFEWRLRRRVRSTDTSWSMEPLLLDGNIVLQPPTLPLFSEELVDEPGQQSWSGQRFENMLRRLDCSRSSIATAMQVAVENYHHADSISQSLLRSIQSAQADFPKLVARLYLVSDILYNSVCVYREASPLRSAIESKISDMIEVFVDLFNSVSGRMKAEMIRKTVITLIDLWEKWSVFPKLLCQNLRFMFTATYRDEVMPSKAVRESDDESEVNEIDGQDIDFGPFWTSELVNRDLDGDELFLPCLMGGTFVCDWPDCGKEYNRPAKLKEHKLSHTAQRPHVCYEVGCGKNFVRPSHLERHKILVHGGESKSLPFECTNEDCGKRFALAHQLKRHLLVHQKEPSPTTAGAKKERSPARVKPVQTIVCGVEGCSFVGNSKSELLRHNSETHLVLRKIKEVPEAKYKCTTEGCPKVFTRKYAMLKHVQTVHMNIRPFECRLCQSTFGHNHLLKRHIAVCHESGEIEEAEASDLNSTEVDADGDLADASTIIMKLSGMEYEAERPFPCLRCRSRFIRQYDLDRHLKNCTA